MEKHIGYIGFENFSKRSVVLFSGLSPENKKINPLRVLCVSSEPWRRGKRAVNISKCGYPDERGACSIFPGPGNRKFC
jgi:hypothetical protein